jgi:hypothetical protein
MPSLDTAFMIQTLNDFRKKALEKKNPEAAMRINAAIFEIALKESKGSAVEVARMMGWHLPGASLPKEEIREGIQRMKRIKEELEHKGEMPQVQSFIKAAERAAENVEAEKARKAARPGMLIRTGSIILPSGVKLRKLKQSH